MKTIRAILLVCAATLGVWLIAAWPLPAHLFTGIPSTGHNTEAETVRRMVPGDHLQLLYHFWLAGDMLAGKTPLFHNPYEFNTGPDCDRYEPDPYYIPFSLLYAGFAALGGRAFGWNMTGWLSLAMTLYLTWRLAARYTPRAPHAALISVVSVLFPYRWIVLLGGSPTGMAMVFVPMMMLGIDRAVREGLIRGGILAGTAVLFAFCSDLHVFFFTVLALPAWCLVAWVAGPVDAMAARPKVAALARALLPTAVLVGVAYLLSRADASELEEAVMAGGWTLKQVAPYSPHKVHLWRWRAAGPMAETYIGYIMPLLCISGVVALALNLRRGTRESARRLLLLLLLGGGIAGVLGLALGMNGPGHGLLLRICRACIPPYRMVRQPAKIFCLLPTLFAVAGTLSLAALTGRGADPPPSHTPARVRRAALHLAGPMLVLLLVIEYTVPIRAGICLLDREQDAYTAVMDDARDSGRPARVMVVPLWPGDTHWSSLYMHYASLVRLPMMNGYRPAVPANYMPDIFKPFESINQGRLTDAQLDHLLDRACPYLLVHEDAFPEKVSPFPVYWTLKQLLEHPRLELLAQDERVRAFRILPAAKPRDDTTPTLTSNAGVYLFPAWRWEVNASPVEPVAIAPRAPVAAAPALRWALRLRGHGRVACTVTTDGRVRRAERIEVAAGPAGSWHFLPIDTAAGFFRPGLTVQTVAGNVTLGTCFLDGGIPLELAPGASHRIPAAAFFHAGFSDDALHAVIFHRDREPARPILYGTLAGLPDGTYHLVLRTESLAPAGARLGVLRARASDGITAQREVSAAVPTRLTFMQTGAEPTRIEFRYLATHDVRIETVTLTRMKEEPSNRSVALQRHTGVTLESHATNANHE